MCGVYSKNFNLIIIFKSKIGMVYHEIAAEHLSTGLMGFNQEECSLMLITSLLVFEAAVLANVEGMCLAIDCKIL